MLLGELLQERLQQKVILKIQPSEELLTPRDFAAALRTIGVSSDPSAVYPLRKSSWSVEDTLE